MNRWHRNTFWLIILFLAACAFYFRLFTQIELPSRYYAFMYGWEAFIWRCLSQGELPLWNPYQNCGQPFLADTRTSFFYPITAFLGLLSFDHSYRLSIFLHIVISGWGSCLLGRRLGMEWKGCALTGLVYMMNGYLLDLLYQGEIFELRGYAWLPWVLWATEGAIAGNKWPRAMLEVALTWLLAITCGAADMCVRLLLMTSIYAVFRCGLFRLNSNRKALGRYSLLLLFAFALGAIQILPLIEYTRLSIRPRTERELLYHSLQPLALLDFIAPDFFGNISDRRVVNSEDSPTVYSLTNWGTWRAMKHVYSGTLSLAMIILALRHARRRQWKRITAQAAGMMAMAVLALFLSMGGSAVVLRFMPKTLDIDAFQHPVHFAPFWLLPLYLLAGAGFDRLLASLPKERRLPLMPRTALIPILVGACLIGLRLAAPELLNNFLLRIQYYSYSNAGKWYIATPLSFMHLLGSCLLLYGVWGLYVNGRLRALGLAFGLLLVLALDLGVRSHRCLEFDRSRANEYGPYYVNMEVLRSLSKMDDFPSLKEYGRVIELYGNGYYGITGALFDVESSQDGSMPKLARFREFLDYYSASFKGDRFYDLREVPLQPHALEMFMGVQHVADRGICDSFTSGKMPGFYPFNLAPAPATAMIGKQLQAYGSVASDPWRQVVVQEKPESYLLIQSASTIPGVVDRIGCQGKRLISIDMPAEGYLYLSDAYYPGWVARDESGTEYPIVPANHAFRAVKLPPGKHKITFSYEPASFRIGENITMAALAVWLGMLLWEVRGRRAREWT